MQVREFVKELARATKDPNFLVTPATEWIEVINSAGSELSPDVMFENSTTINFSDVDGDTLQVDLSSTTAYQQIESVKTVYLIDSEGKQNYYDNWIFDKDTLMLDLSPDTHVEASLAPSATYPTIKIVWLSLIPDTIGTGDISLKKDEMNLFKKICLKEGVRRILMDHLKLDRYRTLVGRSNEYVLLAISRDYAVEIENDKKNLANSGQVRTF